MILVVGACASGKRTYVKSCGVSEDGFLNCEDLLAGQEDLLAALKASQQPSVYNLQAIAAKVPAEDLLEALADKDFLICNEVGAGVVPLEADQRASREATGRLCVLLAAQADKVIRMVCGIPLTLKG